MLRLSRLPAAIVALVVLAFAVVQAAAVAPGNAAFQRTWERTDQPVLAGVVARTWMWGPEANTQPILEEYAESPNGLRTVQYFDKSRMEITNPSGDQNSIWYVTNGLLVVELMTGRLQVGDNTFRQYAPALVNVAGDADDLNGPTYATMAAMRSMPPHPSGSTITTRVDRNGNLTNDPSLAAYGVTAAHRVTVPGIDHQVASPFWMFMNSSGTVYKPSLYVNEPLFQSPFYATGYPVTEAYWATVRVGGTLRLVLLQCFERRCLTYTPGNPPGFETEAGNVGQHYHYWRYVEIIDGSPTATSTRTATGVSATTTTTTATSTSTSTATSTATATYAPPTDYVFVRAWGGLYDPITAFAGSIAVATDGEGNVYIADTENHRIQKYDGNGEYLTGWGSLGSGNGEFNSPFGIAVDSAGNVYVADTYNMRIQKFTSGGGYLTQWPVNHFGSAPALEPYGVAVGPSGNVYVAASIGTHAGVLVYDAAGNYQTQLGVKGNLLGQFDAPWAIAFDRFGRVYVTDIALDKVQIFSAAGVSIQQFGETGSGDNQFDRPAGIAISDDDIVYIADLGNGRVQLHATASAYLSTLELPLDPITPMSVALDNDGNLYVGASEDGVLKFDSQGEYQFRWNDNRRGAFREPAGIAHGRDGTLLAVDGGGDRILRFTDNGVFLSEWGSTGTAPGQFDEPLFIALNSEGEIYVVDRGNDRIQKFDADGNYISQWGSSGSGNGQFMNPIGVALDADDNVYVTDYDLDRVQKFTSEGSYLGQWGSTGSDEGQFNGPEGIAVFGNTVYVVDGLNHNVQAFDRDGAFLFRWGTQGSNDGQFEEPTGIAIDAHGYVYISEEDNHRVQKFTPSGVHLVTFGSRGGGNGQLETPYELDVDAAGNVYVSDWGNRRVQQWAPVE